LKKLFTSDKLAIAIVIMLLLLTALDNAYIMMVAYSIALVVGVVIAYRKDQFRSAMIIIILAGAIASVVALLTLSRR